jgi:hypothetical protein
MMTRGPGRPRYQANDAHRRVVRAMAAYGVPQKEIAASIGISAPTLRLNYADELAKSAAEANAKVAESLFRKALGSTLQSVTAAIFWLKCRAGWCERPDDSRLGKKAQAEAAAQGSRFGGAASNRFLPPPPPPPFRN